ncbi:MAG: PDDEXK nuclease domain-containing protein [Bifidobacteriaceae bacterium]|jgi:predicted nuclease of restriction endonuclease-like (RecB) superfamily|nr:PDDEXK nuclease domain-containing protein [Bifidobacteriaceae bacterium]
MTSNAVGRSEPEGYGDWLADVKARVRATAFRAARAANTEVLRLYWSIGRDILDRQERDGWGAGVVDTLSRDLRAEFPGQSGWSKRNLYWMRKAAEIWPTEEEFVHHVGTQLPWRHITVLLDRLKTREDRDWYAERAAAEGWKRSVLEHFIKVNLKAQIAAAPTNFDAVLAPPESELAQQIVRDPYVFEHLALVERVTERNVEQALMNRLQDTLLEFGRGMAFVGRQVGLEVADEKGDVDLLTVDLLLFHIPQRRYVVVELKVGRFHPGQAGQLGTYVAVVDHQLRDPEFHNPTIGILLCTGKNEATVRFALAATNVPVAVADYAGLPDDAKAALPSVEELQAVVAKEVGRAARE